MRSTILPDAWAVLNFPSGHQRLVNVQPNTTIHIGKFGSFPANAIIYRPYHLTFEILDRADDDAKSKLRVIPPAELLAEQLEQHRPTATEKENETGIDAPTTKDDPLATDGGVEYDIVADDGTVLIRSNRLTIDDPTRQKLSYEEIEALKKAEKGGGKEIIAAILKNHAALDEKTSFSLQKYTVRKKQKYLRRFTVLPLDVARLCSVLHSSNAQRILDIREESLGLLMSWSNARKCGGRWLVVDDTGGLLIAAIAERIGLLCPHAGESGIGSAGKAPQDAEMEGAAPSNEEGSSNIEVNMNAEAASGPQAQERPAEERPADPAETTHSPKKPPNRRPDTYQAARADTITLLHPAAQPNLSILKYFGFPPEDQNPSHPLYSHLKTLSWLSLLSPESDPSLKEPKDPSLAEWATWKSGKQSSHRKKRRRWERTLKLIAETREGGFDGLVVASGGMELAGIFRRLVPLVRGGGQVVCFGATLEPMAELADLYSRERRAAFTTMENERVAKEEASTLPSMTEPNDEDAATKTNSQGQIKGTGLNGTHEAAEEGPPELTEENLTTLAPFVEDHAADREDFPVNPVLLLGPTLQTVRAKHWQVLPGRTHPQMMEQGGPEGYVFAATRVIPAQGRIEARGRYQKSKKRKAEDVASAPAMAVGSAEKAETA